MSHTPDSLPQPPDVLAALREATGGRHADGPQAEALLPGVWRLPLVEADLADAALPAGGMAAPAAEPAGLPALRAEPAWRWGICHVIEGVQLGGAVLHRRLSAALRPHPLRFLKADEAGPGPRWQQFVQALRSQVRTEAAIALACQGACAPFDRLLAIAAPRRR